MPNTPTREAAIRAAGQALRSHSFITSTRPEDRELWDSTEELDHALDGAVRAEQACGILTRFILDAYMWADAHGFAFQDAIDAAEDFLDREAQR
jgi:hypothetical protein